MKTRIPYNTSDIVGSLYFQHPLKVPTENKAVDCSTFAAQMRELCGTEGVLRNCAARISSRAGAEA